MSLRDEIDAIQDLHPHRIHVEAWNKDVFVLNMSPLDLADILNWIKENPGDNPDKVDALYLARLVAKMLCDESGALLYDPNNEDDVRALAKKSLPALQSIGRQFWRKNDARNEDVEAAKKN